MSTVDSRTYTTECYGKSKVFIESGFYSKEEIAAMLQQVQMMEDGFKKHQQEALKVLK